MMSNMSNVDMKDSAEKREWIDWMNAKILQKAIVVDERGNILTIKRAENRPGARLGKWDLPGGSMSPEDFSQNQPNPNELAITREIREETKLEILSVKVIHVESGVKNTKSSGNVLVLALGYRCLVNGIKPTVALSEEHTEFKWVSKEELENTDFGDDGGFHKRIVDAS